MRIISMPLIAAACAAALPASAQTVATFGGGVSSGDYGSTRDTTIATATLGVRTTFEGFDVSASLPWISIDSPGLILAGFDGTPLVMSPDLGGPRRTRSDVGDPTFTVSRAFAAGSARITPTARVKIPIHDFGGVSTGRVDWSLGLDGRLPVGRVTPFAAVSWRSFGDPTGWRIRDGLATSVGASAPVGPGSLAVSWEHARSTSRYVGDADEAVAVYDAPVSDRLRLASYGTIGLSDGAPALGAGVRLAYRF